MLLAGNSIRLPSAYDSSIQKTYFRMLKNMIKFCIYISIIYVRL
jgi:hypothetical protein